MFDIMEKASFATLPVEMTMTILELLAREDILTVAQTCKSVASVAADYLHRHIIISTMDEHYGAKVSLVHQSFVQSNVRVLKCSSTDILIPAADAATVLAFAADAMAKISTVFHLYFPRLTNLTIDTNMTCEAGSDCQLFVSFLARHPTITVLELHIEGNPDYYDYDHDADDYEVWRSVTPDFLPSLTELSTDCAFLCALASKHVSSLRQLNLLHIKDQCVGEQNSLWCTIRDAKSSFDDLPTLALTQLPRPAAMPGTVAVWDVMDIFPYAFRRIQHLATNIGEDGKWDAELLISYLKDLRRLKTLSIPVRVARDIISSANLDGVDQTPPGEQAIPAYSRDDDLAYRQTPEIQQMVADIRKTLVGIRPALDIIIHLPGWRPDLMAF